MKKSSSTIRTNIARLQEQLKQAETDEAQRIGRIALKAGLGEIEVDDEELRAAFEELAKRFRSGKSRSAGKGGGEGGIAVSSQASVSPGATAHGTEEA
jgi:hypothetical protein